MMTKFAPLYFDYAATTPLDPRVIKAMMNALRDDFANPSSGHPAGLAVRQRLETARSAFAEDLGVDARELVFTSGATEADNLALKGCLLHPSQKKRHLITVKTEHKAVLDSAHALSLQGVECSYLDVNAQGLIDLNQLEDALKAGDVALVSVMLVNNETGVIQPLTEISALCRRYEARLHSDAVQALAYVDLKEIFPLVDMLSMSAHKIYGPKGSGALYVRRLPKVRLQAQMNGGGHERGRRSGTLAVHQIIGLCQAGKLALTQRAQRCARVELLRAQLLAALAPAWQSALAESTPHAPHIVNVHSEHPAQQVLTYLEQCGIYLSAGSACQTASADGSYVLRAMGSAYASRSLRISLSHLTSEEEIATLAQCLNQFLEKQS